MATRIMLWNIQDLGINKFLPNAGDPNQLRQQHITDTIQRVDPDILIVLEIETAAMILGNGTIVSHTSGGPAVLALLYHLRSVDADGQWCVVPPLILGSEGNKEGVAVFFKNSKLDFRGPFQTEWRDLARTVIGSGGLSDAPAPAYPDPWAGALPAAPPSGGAIGANLNQNQLAGRWAYPDPASPIAPLTFPSPEKRPPFQTNFIEKTIGGRSITLFSLHAPSKANKAIEALEQIAKIDDVERAHVGGEIRVIAGDFNINLLNPNYTNGYDSLTELGYELAIKPFLQNIATHMAPIPLASLSGDESTAPYYGYMSQGPPTGPNRLTQLPDPNWPRKCLDNFLIHPQEAARLGTIVNRVFSFPGAIPSALQNSIKSIKDHPGLTTDQKNDLFRDITNFGKIRGASDHMAIYIDL